MTRAESERSICIAFLSVGAAAGATGEQIFAQRLNLWVLWGLATIYVIAAQIKWMRYRRVGRMRGQSTSTEDV